MHSTDARKLTAKQLTDLRIRAIKAVQEGQSPELVAKALCVHRSTLYGWLAKYRSGGWHKMDAKKRGGRPPKISAKNIHWIYDTVTMKQPEQMQFPFALWSLKILRQLIKKHLGIEISKSSLHRLLGQLGLSVQRPLWRAWQQDEERVKEFKEKEFPAIAKRAKAQGGEIWFGDEAGVRSDAHGATTWAKQGETPIVRSSGGRFGLNLISAISRRGEMRFMLVDGKMNSEKFVEFLQRLIKGSERKIFLIIDNHPSHKSKKTREFVEQNSQNIELHYLPPYSPELNPDEHVWNELKNQTVKRKSIAGPNHLKQMILSYMRKIQRLPEKVKSYFRAEETRYSLMN